MISHGCACQRIDQIESEMIRIRALLAQRQRELAAMKADLAPERVQPAAADGVDGIIPLADLERKAIEDAVRKKGIVPASKLLGIGKTTLYRKLQEYGRLAPTAAPACGWKEEGAQEC
jgi:DNA-binding NtrC family response regulator